MGLDITSISKIEKSEKEKGFYINRGNKYVARHDYTEGWYVATEDSSCHEFRAGSYSGHNNFRKLLVEAIHGVEIEHFWHNEEEYEGAPFYEMLNFSDCEGVIGVEESKKLHEDFVLHRGIFEDFVRSQYDKTNISIRAEYMELYDDWLKSFNIAADKGAVLFR